METQCPNCQTVFELADEDLNRADGKVRCGECATVFDGREHLPTETDEDNPSFAETGVGWVLLPADESVPENEKDNAQYLSSAEDEGWKAVGRPQNSRASNTDPDEPLRFDDNSPLPEDNLRLAETMAHETTPVVFKIVDSKTVDTDDDDNQSPESIDQETSDDTSGPIDVEADAGDGDGDGTDSSDDWAELLAEIDQSNTTNESSEESDSENTESASEADDELTPTAIDVGSETDDDSASAVDLVADDLQPDTSSDETDSAAAANGESADAEIDAGLLAALGDSESNSDSDFFDDVLAELPDRSSVDIPAASLEEAIAAESDSDEEVDSSGIFVQENVLPDEDELADVVPSANAEASIVESIDNEHFVDTGASDDIPENDVADTPGWLSDEVEAPETQRWHKIAMAALVILGVLQFAHFERHALATKLALNPWYQKVYGEALVPDWDVTQMCFEQHDAVANDDRMQIVGLVVNRGDRAQPYPLLHVILSGRLDSGSGDQARAHAVLDPTDYLLEGAADQWVGPNVRFGAQAEFPDDQQISGYELEVCYQGPNGTLACNGPC